jgi:N-acyl-D-amino-acid deacylase
MVRRHDGLSWAVLFNTDRSGTSGETLSGLIDPLVHRAVNEVKELSMGW